MIAAIGQGGMGEVYRARDTKLDRCVALKILPEAFAHDPERVARFQREAKGVVVEGGTPPVFGAPTMLFQGWYFVGSEVQVGTPGRTYDISPDGRRFLMLKDVDAPNDASAISRLIVVQHWDQELRQLVPRN
ncbi:MAG: hypothetical protein HYU37_05250 [Acidobacteria bacterium]|nr:hypothetical protein [Acidobacteriota bacterium]